MKQREAALLELPPDWNPEAMARLIEKEVEHWWNEGWVFVAAHTDGLMENVVLQFERELE